MDIDEYDDSSYSSLTHIRFLRSITSFIFLLCPSKFLLLYQSESSGPELGSLISPTPDIDLLPMAVYLNENNSK